VPGDDAGVRIALDQNAPASLSDQLAKAIAGRIHRGSLAPGSRLPTVRALAEDLDLAANTVAKAYRALEEEGCSKDAGGTGPSWPTGFPFDRRGRPRCSRTPLSPSSAEHVSSAPRMPPPATPSVGRCDRPIDVRVASS